MMPEIAALAFEALSSTFFLASLRAPPILDVKSEALDTTLRPVCVKKAQSSLNNSYNGFNSFAMPCAKSCCDRTAVGKSAVFGIAVGSILFLHETFFTWFLYAQERHWLRPFAQLRSHGVCWLIVPRKFVNWLNFVLSPVICLSLDRLNINSFFGSAEYLNDSSAEDDLSTFGSAPGTREYLPVKCTPAGIDGSFK
uniref:Uncharacterized protein n=1 Tax=Romanomermis culicivorax TaxID=13658 RepID=A0A915L4S4_ROMCU